MFAALTANSVDMYTVAIVFCTMMYVGVTELVLVACVFTFSLLFYFCAVSLTVVHNVYAQLSNAMHDISLS